MASQYDIDIRIDVESASLGELESELGRLNDELKQIPRSSAEFNKAAANVRKVTGEVDKANKSLQKVDVGQLVGDFAKVGAAIGAVGIAISTFGEEGSQSNEAIQKTLEKTQAILALVAVAEGAVSAARLASAASTKVYTIAQNLANKSIQAGTISLKGLKAALISTGIGALIVALGLLVANFDKISEWISGGAIGDYEDQLEKADKALGALNANLDQQLAYNDRLAAQGEDEIKNQERRITYLEEYQKKAKEVNDETLASLRKVQQQRGYLTEEELEQQRKIFAENEKNNKAVIDANNEKNAILLKREDEANKRQVDLLKAQGEETYDVELQNLKDRLELLKTFGAAFADEVAATEAEITRREAEEAEKRRQAAIKRAEERRARIKSELNEIAQIIQQDPVQALRLLNDEQDRALEILQKYSGGSRDITKIIQELEKEGLTPLANQFRALADSGNYEEFDKLIKEYFGRRFRSTIDTAIQELIAFESAFPSIADTLRKLTKQLEGEVTVDLIEIVRPGEDGEVENAFSEVTEENKKSAAQAIKELQEAGAKLTAELQTQQTKAAAELKRLLDEGILDQAEYDKQLQLLLTRTQIQTEQIADEVASGTGEILAETFRQTEFANQKAINSAQRELDNLGKNYTGFKGFLRSFKDDRVQEEITAQKAILDARDKALNDQKTQVENQAKFGVITEQEKAEQIEAIDQELHNNNMERLKLENEERLKGLAAALELYDQLRAGAQAYSDFVGQQAELFNARLDVQIAKEEKNLELQLEGIDNEEERARVTAAAETKIGAIKDQQIRNTAEAQKKQANISMGLAISEITVQTGLAIMKALAQLGPVAGAIATGIIAATGALQIATAINARNTAVAQADASLASIGSGGLSPSSTGGRTQFAEGGFVSGAGGPTSDSIPAMLSNGEFVINAESTRRYLPLLEEINNTPEGYAMGGLVNPPGYFLGGIVYATKGVTIDEMTLEVLKRLDQRLEKPIKSYVVASEIQEGLDSDQYLERRSQIT